MKTQGHNTVMQLDFIEFKKEMLDAFASDFMNAGWFGSSRGSWLSLPAVKNLTCGHNMENYNIW
jgi:hypothetical protein